MAAPADFINYIDSNKDSFIDRLAKAVEIPGYVPRTLIQASSGADSCF